MVSEKNLDNLYLYLSVISEVKDRSNLVFSMVVIWGDA